MTLLFKIKAFILIILLSFNCSAVEVFSGTGQTWKAEDPNNFYSIAVEHGDYRFDIVHFESYRRVSDCCWTHEGDWSLIKKHTFISATRRILDANIVGDLYFYFDLGLALTDRRSIASSSHLLFKENMGLRYQKARLFLSHTSNAGIVGDNVGEDGIMFEYSINF